MDLADEGGEDVGVVQVIVVVRAIEIGRHGADEVFAVLTGVGLAEFDPGNFRQGVGVVGRLERSGQQRILGNGLRRHFWVDAGTSQKKQFACTEVGGGLDEIVLDGQVLQEKFRRLFVVGENAADLGGRVHDHGRALFFEELAHGTPIEEVELGPGAADNIGEAALEQALLDGAADHAAMSGYEYCLVLLQFHPVICPRYGKDPLRRKKRSFASLENLQNVCRRFFYPLGEREDSPGCRGRR